MTLSTARPVVALAPHTTHLPLPAGTVALRCRNGHDWLSPTRDTPLDRGGPVVDSCPECGLGWEAIA